MIGKTKQDYKHELIDELTGVRYGTNDGRRFYALPETVEPFLLNGVHVWNIRHRHPVRHPVVSKRLRRLLKKMNRPRRST